MATRGARSQLRPDEGFTLIELLVVVTVIAILAGIAIPVFLNQRTKGYQASLTRSLKDAGSVAVAYAVGSQGSFAGLDGDDGTILASAGFRSPPGVHVAVSASVAAYCVLATHESLPGGHVWKVATIDGATGAPAESDTCTSVPTPAVPGPVADPEPTEVPSAESPVEPTAGPTTAAPAPTPTPLPTQTPSSAPLPVDLPPITLPPCTAVLRPPLCTR